MIWYKGFLPRKIISSVTQGHLQRHFLWIEFRLQPKVMKSFFYNRLSSRKSDAFLFEQHESLFMITEIHSKVYWKCSVKPLSLMCFWILFWDTTFSHQGQTAFHGPEKNHGLYNCCLAGIATKTPECCNSKRIFNLSCWLSPSVMYFATEFPKQWYLSTIWTLVFSTHCLLSSSRIDTGVA